MKYTLGILFVFLFFAPAKSQTATGWKNYTDMKEINSFIPLNNGIWAATSGGGFYYNSPVDSFKTLHKADGLEGENLTAVTIDKSGRVWFGSANGIIDVYNPKDNSIKSILDIYNSDKSSKQINDIAVSGDTVIVSTSFGISLIDSKNFTFYDTFFRFGSFSSNIQVNNTLKSNLIYASTVMGVAIQKPGTTNLSAPESWNVYTNNEGLPSNTINKILFYNGNLIAATSSGLAQFNGSTWQSFLPQLNYNINDIATGGDTLFILANNQISAYINNNLISIYNSPLSISLLAYSSTMGLIAGGANGFITSKNFTNNIFESPNGPEVNQFPDMVVDNNGVLWSASGRDVTGEGFYSFNGLQWKNYNMSNTKSLPSNAYHVVYASPDNSIYFGSWGRGFIRIQNDTITTFDTSKTGMKGIDSDPNFLVISGFANDSKNDLWVLNYGAIDQKTLSVMTPEGRWYNYRVPSMGNQFLAQNFNLAIDQYDTKWFSCSDANRPGLFYFNENGTFNSTNDDESGYLTQSDGLNSNSISCVVADARGDIWVGTNAGANIVSNTGSITSNSAPLFSITSVFTLREQTINCIAVDPLNQKWVGTNQGLLYVNSDGTSLLAVYNSQNSPLLSDAIRSITVDKNTGTVYVGTDEGLTSFKTPAIQPQESFTKLFVYPSPFVLGNSTNQLTIDGLVSNCNIKIISINGKLIKEFSSPGGRVAYWDGTDNSGNRVSSGVYLVVAYTQDGNSVFTGKIAVINK